MPTTIIIIDPVEADGTAAPWSQLHLTRVDGKDEDNIDVKVDYDPPMTTTPVEPVEPPIEPPPLVEPADPVEPIEPLPPPTEPPPETAGQLAEAVARLAEIATMSAKSSGGSADKTRQIARIHARAVEPLAP